MDLSSIFDYVPPQPKRARAEAGSGGPSPDGPADDHQATGDIGEDLLEAMMTELGLTAGDADGDDGAFDARAWLRDVCAPLDAGVADDILDELAALQKDDPGSDTDHDHGHEVDRASGEPEDADAAPVAPHGPRVGDRWVALGLQSSDGCSFSDACGKRVGKIHRIGTSGIKATCQLHAGCVCWLTSMPNGIEQAQLDLATWLSKAAPPLSFSGDVHRDSGDDLKRTYGMRPRRRK